MPQPTDETEPESAVQHEATLGHMEHISTDTPSTSHDQMGPPEATESSVSDIDIHFSVVLVD